jgi:hypothetical protein
VGDERPAEGYDQHLQPAAHPEQGYAGRGGRAYQRQLVLVARAVDVERRGRVAAVERWVDVAAAGEHECVHQVEEPHRAAAGSTSGRPPAAATRSTYGRGVPVTSSSTCGRGTT